MLEWCWYYTL